MFSRTNALAVEAAADARFQVLECYRNLKGEAKWKMFMSCRATIVKYTRIMLYLEHRAMREYGAVI